ncbi:MAG: hypothetical protein SNF33_05110 [Candidatus Algichlamydia australiensis]|nr:hypothetical protein [Chlamydiales bacterium]
MSIPSKFEKNSFYSGDVPLGGVNPNAMLGKGSENKYATYDTFSYHVFNPERYALRQLYERVRSNREYLEAASQRVIDIQNRVVYLCQRAGLTGIEPRGLETQIRTVDKPDLPDKSQKHELCNHFPPIVDSGALEDLINENRRGCWALIEETKENHHFNRRLRSVMTSTWKHLRDCKAKIAKTSYPFDGNIDCIFRDYDLPHYPNIENQANGTSWELLRAEYSDCNVEIQNTARVLRPIHETIDKLVEIAIKNREEVRYTAGLVNALGLTIGWLERYFHERELRLQRQHIVNVINAFPSCIESSVNELITQIVTSFESACSENSHLDEETVEDLIDIVEQKRAAAGQVFSSQHAKNLKKQIYALDKLPKTLFTPQRVYKIVSTNSSWEGYELSAHAYYPTREHPKRNDFRNRNSVYASAHKKYLHNNTLFLVTRDNGETYQIILTFDERYHKLDRDTNQTGWGLSLIRGDKPGKGPNRSQVSTYASFCKNPSTNSYWKLKRVGTGNKFTISLAKDNTGTGQKGWELCVHRAWPSDERDSVSTYIIGHMPASDRENNHWSIL